MEGPAPVGAATPRPQEGKPAQNPEAAGVGPLLCFLVPSQSWEVPGTHSPLGGMGFTRTNRALGPVPPHSQRASFPLLQGSPEWAQLPGSLNTQQLTKIRCPVTSRPLLLLLPLPRAL